MPPVTTGNASPDHEHEFAESRPPPLIIRVPPPERPPFKTGGLVLAVLLPVAAVVLVGYGLFSNRSSLWVALAIGIFAALFIPAILRTDHAYVRRRQAVMAALEGRPAHPAGQLLAQQWERTRERPTPDEVMAVLRNAPEGQDRARVVCLGGINVPEPGDVRVEPEIIPTSRFLGRRRWFIPVAGIVLVVWAAQRIGLLPGFPVARISWTYVLIGVIAAGVWTWRTLVRPGYIRFAPGILQFLEFGAGRRNPIIHSYPMDAGTVLVVSGLGEQLTLTFSREGRRDTLPLGQMRKPERQLERIWPALLSTAPTPPLSDEELLG